MSAVNKRLRAKRPRAPQGCAFCETNPAAVVVNLVVIRGGKRKEALSLCWMHFYTSRAVRTDEKDIKVLSGNAQAELKQTGVQDLFGQAYLELQQELTEQAARSFQKSKQDPLAILNSFRGKPKKPPVPDKNRKIDRNAGGFMRSMAVPEKFRQTQKAVQKQQLRQTIQANPYEKRKPSRHSIWKLAMETAPGPAVAAVARVTGPNVTCSCGSKNVVVSGNVTSLNSNVQKAETWGFKDRADEVLSRCRCNQCGKTWMEEE